MKQLIIAKYALFILLFWSNLTPALSNHLGNNTDTLLLYEKLSGIGTKIYFRTWMGGSYSYRLDKLTKQDSIIVNGFMEATYVKLYNLKNQLVIEGLVNSRVTAFGLMTGDIKFYKKGQLIRIEHWDPGTIEDSCNYYLGTETPFPLGTWSYFKRGRLLKTKVIEIKLKPNSNCNYEEIITTTKYSKKGKVLRVKKRHKNVSS